MENARAGSTRPQFLAGGAVVGISGFAGCLGSVLGESSAAAFEPTAPDDPPSGTPEEFYYVLENGLEGYDLTVVDLYENDGDLILRYESDVEESDVEPSTDEESALEGDDDANNESVDDDGNDSADDVANGKSAEDDGDAHSDSVEDDGLDVDIDGDLQQATMDEVGVIVEAYNQTVVQHGGGDEYGMLVGEIATPLEGQAYGWGVKHEWLEAYNAEELAEFSLWMQISQPVALEDVDAVSG